MTARIDNRQSPIGNRSIDDRESFDRQPIADGRFLDID
jgi:hypothetical protein